MSDERERDLDGDASGMRDAGWSSGKGRPSSAAENEEAIAFGRKFGLGCFTFIVGFFSGGMVAVLVGRMVAFFTKAPSCEGLPICDWFLYVGIGGALGAVSLPTLVLRRLSRKQGK